MIDLKLQLFGGRGSGGGRGRSGKSGGGGKSEDKVQEKIKELPKDTERSYEDQDLRVNPIPLSDEFSNNPEVFDYIDNIESTKNYKNAKVESVSIDKITAIQPTVDADELSNKVSKYGVEGAISSKGFGGSSIKVAEVGNEFIILDGNHRVALAKLAGKKTIKAKVVHR